MITSTEQLAQAITQLDTERAKKALMDTLTASEYWNAQYDNFDATTSAAKDYLHTLGYIIADWQTIEGIGTEYITAPAEEQWAVDAILTGFDRHEPNYGRYEHAWQAKEAQASYSPKLSYLIRLDYLPTIVEAKKIEKQQEKQRWTLNVARATLTRKYHNPSDKTAEYGSLYDFESWSQTRNAARAQYSSYLHATPNGRKYKAAYGATKYATMDEAVARCEREIADRMATCDKYIAEARTNIEDAIATLQSAEEAIDWTAIPDFFKK